MNQRDQNHRGGQRERQGRYGAMPQSGEQGGRKDQGQQRQRTFAESFTDTYNPEPQWLREQGSSGQRYGQPLGGGDYDRNDEDYRGGRYATTGQQGQRGYRDEQGYGRQQSGQSGSWLEDRSDQGGRMGYGQQDRDDGRRYGQRMGGRWDEDRYGSGERFGGERQSGAGGFGGGEYGSERYASDRYGSDKYGSDRYEYAGEDRQRTGYEPSRYAMSGYGRSDFGRSDYGPLREGRTGYGASRLGSQFESDYGGGGYDQVSGVGGYGYRGRTPYATGDYQSGLEGQRSYRGLGPQTYKRSDDRIRDDVCERLTDDPRIDASNITIDVNQGAVTLNGVVPERHMRYAAEDLVDDAMGVESINNQLRVQSRGDTTSMASGSRATAASEMEKQKH